MIGLIICIIIGLFLTTTTRGKLIRKLIRFKYLVARHETFPAWVKANKDSKLLRMLETAKWFPWYGKTIIYVKPKNSSDLTVTERAVRDAINAKDYTKAMSIVEQLPDSPRTVLLKQVIQAKIK